MWRVVVFIYSNEKRRGEYLIKIKFKHYLHQTYEKNYHLSRFRIFLCSKDMEGMGSRFVVDIGFQA